MRDYTCHVYNRKDLGSMPTEAEYRQGDPLPVPLNSIVVEADSHDDAAEECRKFWASEGIDCAVIQTVRK